MAVTIPTSIFTAAVVYTPTISDIDTNRVTPANSILPSISSVGMIAGRIASNPFVKPNLMDSPNGTSFTRIAALAADSSTDNSGSSII